MHIGLSLDGPQSEHDRERVDGSGRGTHARILKNLKSIRENYPLYWGEHLESFSTNSYKSDLEAVARYFEQGKHFTTATVLLGLVASLGVVFYLQAKAFLDQPNWLSRLLARWHGYKYLGGIDIHIPRPGKICGPVAMQVILRLYGVSVPFESLRRDLMDSPQGTSVRRMKEVAQKYGFRTLATRVCLADVPRIPLPSIALVKRRHYVVVEALAPDGSVIIIEPSIGRCQLGVSRFLKACRGETLLFLTNAECPTRENKAQALNRECSVST